MEPRYAVNWTSGPPAKERRGMLRIVHAPKEGFLDLVILSQHICGVWTHWMHGRTLPCQAGFGCECEKASIPTRWKGYLAAALVTDGKVVLAELTGDSARSLMLQDNVLTGPPLRGLTLRLSRDRHSKGQRVIAGIRTVPRFASEAMPAEPDVHAELLRIWRSCH